MRPGMSAATLATVLFLVCPIPTTLAQEKPAKNRLTVEKVLDWERVGDPQISPDGTRIVYQRQWVDRKSDRWTSDLMLLEDDGRRERFLVRGFSPRFSPDGTRLAYMAETPGSGTQIFVLDLRSPGESTQITRVEESPAGLSWSPDGRSIAFTMPVAKQPGWKIDLPTAPKGATWTEAPRIIETTHYRADREGFLKDAFVHLFVVPAGGGTPRALTEGPWNVGSRADGIPENPGIDWTPDGKEILFDGLMDEDADRRWQESHLYAVKVADGSIRRITTTKGPWTHPTVSPDGRRVAFTGFDWTPSTYHAGDVYVIGIDGQGMKKISGTLDRDVDDLHWAPDNSGVYASVEDHGSRNVLFVPLDGARREVTKGTQLVSLSSTSRNGIAVGTRTTFLEPDDVVRYRLAGGARPEVLTHVNDDVLQGVTLGAVEEITARSGDGTPVQGWLVKPPDFDAAKKYPLILHIHGGPNSMYNVGFNLSFQNLAANGYVVLYTNPRGSTGYGSAFGNAIDDAYPSVDFDDLMTMVDAAEARGFVDTAREYVTGVSGGGVLSAWCTSHTHRFAAAAVRAPVIDWISFAGTTDISAWGYFRYRGRFWEDPKKWLDHSPLMHVGEVKTPTLLMTGELDLRTPIGQTEEYYQALRALGVPTTMIRFNGEYHGTGSKPSNFMRTQLYLLSWFQRWPQAKTASADAPQPAGS
jgi:dipeptidyl aminopeptidase/acylaminoacyl peptidase